jgi:hypothetical protein
MADDNLTNSPGATPPGSPRGKKRTYMDGLVDRSVDATINPESSTYGSSQRRYVNIADNPTNNPRKFSRKYEGRYYTMNGEVFRKPGEVAGAVYNEADVTGRAVAFQGTGSPYSRIIRNELPIVAGDPAAVRNRRLFYAASKDARLANLNLSGAGKGKHVRVASLDIMGKNPIFKYIKEQTGRADLYDHKTFSNANHILGELKTGFGDNYNKINIEGFLSRYAGIPGISEKSVKQAAKYLSANEGEPENIVSKRIGELFPKVKDYNQLFKFPGVPDETGFGKALLEESSNPIIKSLRDLSYAIVEGGPVASIEGKRAYEGAYGILSNKIAMTEGAIEYLRSVTQQSVLGRHGMSNAQLFDLAKSSLSNIASAEEINKAITADHPYTSLSNLAQNYLSSFYEQRNKLAAPYQYRDIFDEIMSDLVQARQLGNVTPEVLNRQIEDNMWSGLQNSFRELGMDVKFNGEDLSNAINIVKRAGIDSNAGLFGYDYGRGNSAARGLFPHLRPTQLGETAYDTEEFLEREYTEGFNDIMRDMARTDEKLAKAFRKTAARNVHGGIGIGIPENFNKRLNRMAGRRGLYMSDRGLSKFVNTEVNFDGRNYIITGVDKDQFLLKSKNTANLDLFVDVNDFNELFTGRGTIKTNNAIMDLVGMRALSAEKAMGAAVPKLTQQNADRELARFVAGRLIDYKATPAEEKIGEKILSKAERLMKAQYSVDPEGLLMTRYFGFKVPWQVRDIMTKNLPFAVSSLAEADSGHAPSFFDDAAEDLVSRMNYAFAQTISENNMQIPGMITDMSHPDYYKQFSNKAFMQKLRVNGPAFEKQFMKNYWKVTSEMNGGVEASIKSAIKRIVNKDSNDMAKELTDEQVSKVIYYLMNSPENELLMNNTGVSELVRILKQNPAEAQQIIKRIGGSDGVLSLDAPIKNSKLKIDEAESNTRFGDMIADPNAEAVFESVEDRETAAAQNAARKRFAEKIRREAAKRSALEETGPRPVRPEGGSTRTRKVSKRELEYREAVADWKKRYNQNFLAAKERVLDDAGLANEISRLRGGNVRAEMLPGGGVRFHLIDHKDAVLFDNGELNSNLGPIGVDRVNNALIDSSGRMVGSLPINAKLAAEYVLNKGRISDRVERLMASMDNSIVLLNNLKASTYGPSHHAPGAYGDWVRTLDYAHRIQGGSRFGIIDLETSGLPSAGQLSGNLDAGVPFYQALEGSIREGAYDRAGKFVESRSTNVRFAVDEYTANRVKTLLGPNNDWRVLRENPQQLKTYINELRLTAENTADKALKENLTEQYQFLNNTIGKYQDFFDWAQGGSRHEEGLRNFSEFSNRLTEIKETGTIALAHNARGAEGPWLKHYFGVDLNEIGDTELMARMARTGGYLDADGSRNFKQESIMNEYGLGGQAHTAGEDTEALSKVLYNLSGDAINGARGVDRLEPGQYVVKHSGAFRGGMKFLGTDQIEDGVYAANFQRLSNGEAFSLVGESQAELQHMFSRYMTSASEEGAHHADQVFLEDAARREAAAAYTNPARARKLENDMNYLRRTASENGIGIQELNMSHFDINSDEGLRMTQSRLNVLQRMEDWYGQSYQKHDYLQNVMAARELGMISNKDARALERQYYSDFREAMGKAMPRGQAGDIWSAGYNVNYAGNNLRVSLASQAEAERSIQGAVNKLTEYKEGPTVGSSTRMSYEDAMAEIARQSGVEGIDGSRMNTSSLAAELMKNRESMPLPEYENPLALSGSPEEAAAIEQANSSAMERLRKKLGKNADIGLKDIDHYQRLRNLELEPERFVKATKNLKRKSQWSYEALEEEVQKAAGAIGGAAPEATERVRWTSMFEQGSEMLQKMFKGHGKAVAITAGLLGAGYVFSNFTSNAPLAVDNMPQHDQAPGGDGVFDQQAGTGQRNVYMSPEGSGYNGGGGGYRFRVNATNSDPSLNDASIGGLIKEAFNSAAPMDVRLNINNTDNTSRLDNTWYQQRIADAMRG